MMKFNLMFTLTVLAACVYSVKGANPALRTRQEVLTDYNTSYLTSAVSAAELDWTGNADAGVCNAGTISQTAHDRTLQRVNFFRRMAGLNHDIVFRPDWDSKCMEAALMMKANGKLDHSPPSNWDCYTAEGAEAAGKSNLYNGIHSASAISGWMVDGGSGNYAAGHRRWILFSRAREFGHGSTNSSSALWVIGNGSNPLPDSMPDFIAYPPAGFVLAPLIYSRWSFGIPGADFRSASVAMEDEQGSAVTLSTETISHNSYGDNTIVWVPSGIDKSSTDDVVYTVNVTGISNADQSEYTYDVTIIQPESSGLREVPERQERSSVPQVGRCMPNPFNPETGIRYWIPKEAHVSIKVYGPDGRIVRILASGKFSAGFHIIAWNGTDKHEQTVGNGVYVCRIETCGRTFVKKMVLIR
jgi:uncharacterized protein YkwD